MKNIQTPGLDNFQPQAQCRQEQIASSGASGSGKITLLNPDLRLYVSG